MGKKKSQGNFNWISFIHQTSHGFNGFDCLQIKVSDTLLGQKTAGEVFLSWKKNVNQKLELFHFLGSDQAS